jgi:parallel beta-helix repeat protein
MNDVAMLRVTVFQAKIDSIILMGEGGGQMLKTAALLGTVLLCAMSAPAADYQTPGSGESYTLTVLASASAGTVTGGPTLFFLNGNLTISQNDTLIVNPGEWLTVGDDPAGLGLFVRINGTLLAKGTPALPIVFTAITAEQGAWRGIFMTPTCLGSVVEYCDISYATTGIHCAGCNPILKNNTFSRCRDAGIYCCRGARPKIASNTFVANSQGIGIVLNNCEPSVCANNSANLNLTGIAVANSDTSPVIEQNSTIANFQIGIYSADTRTAVFRDNIVENNAYGIMVAHQSASQFSANQVAYNWREGISVVDEAVSLFRENLIEHNGSELGGIVVFDDAQPDLGTAESKGLNRFLNNTQYDYVNFTPLRQTAIGNTWTTLANIDALIYDNDEDVSDADGSGFLSGIVVYRLQLRGNLWFLY